MGLNNFRSLHADDINDIWSCPLNANCTKPCFHKVALKISEYVVFYGSINHQKRKISHMHWRILFGDILWLLQNTPRDILYTSSSLLRLSGLWKVITHTISEQNLMYGIFPHCLELTLVLAKCVSVQCSVLSVSTNERLIQEYIRDKFINMLTVLLSDKNRRLYRCIDNYIHAAQFQILHIFKITEWKYKLKCDHLKQMALIVTNNVKMSHIVKHFHIKHHGLPEPRMLRLSCLKSFNRFMEMCHRDMKLKGYPNDYDDDVMYVSTSESEDDSDDDLPVISQETKKSKYLSSTIYTLVFSDMDKTNTSCINTIKSSRYELLREQETETRVESDIDVETCSDTETSSSHLQTHKQETIRRKVLQGLEPEITISLECEETLEDSCEAVELLETLQTYKPDITIQNRSLTDFCVFTTSQTISYATLIQEDVTEVAQVIEPEVFSNAICTRHHSELSVGCALSNVEIGLNDTVVKRNKRRKRKWLSGTKKGNDEWQITRFTIKRLNTNSKAPEASGSASPTIGEDESKILTNQNKDNFVAIERHNVSKQINHQVQLENLLVEAARSSPKCSLKNDALHFVSTAGMPNVVDPLSQAEQTSSQPEPLVPSTNVLQPNQTLSKPIILSSIVLCPASQPELALPDVKNSVLQSSQTLNPSLNASQPNCCTNCSAVPNIEASPNLIALVYNVSHTASQPTEVMPNVQQSNQSLTKPIMSPKLSQPITAMPIVNQENMCRTTFPTTLQLNRSDVTNSTLPYPVTTPSTVLQPNYITNGCETAQNFTTPIRDLSYISRTAKITTRLHSRSTRPTTPLPNTLHTYSTNTIQQKEDASATLRLKSFNPTQPPPNYTSASTSMQNYFYNPAVPPPNPTLHPCFCCYTPQNSPAYIQYNFYPPNPPSFPTLPNVNFPPPRIHTLNHPYRFASHFPGQPPRFGNYRGYRSQPY